MEYILTARSTWDLSCTVSTPQPWTSHGLAGFDPTRKRRRNISFQKEHSHSSILGGHESTPFADIITPGCTRGVDWGWPNPGCTRGTMFASPPVVKITHVYPTLVRVCYTDGTQECMMGPSDRISVEQQRTVKAGFSLCCFRGALNSSTMILYPSLNGINVSLVPRPSLTAFFAAVQKAWLRPGSKHHVMCAIAFVTTRVHGFICIRDVFHVALSRDSSNTVFYRHSLR